MSEKQTEYVMTLLLKELTQYRPNQIKKVLELLEEGNTVPFIARYRKEVTGSLDEVMIREIEERFNYLQNLEKRREEILRLIGEQDKLTPELTQMIQKAETMQKLEDIYRPYKQKRRTKATIAKEKGLEPFANWLLSFPVSGNVEEEATHYLSDEFEVNTTEEVIAGAHEIIAELVGDEPKYREWIRTYTNKFGEILSTVKEAEKDEKEVFEMYYDYQEKVKSIVSHRILAVNRGEKEGILKVEIVVPEEKIMAYLEGQIVGKQGQSVSAKLVRNAYQDSYKRFIKPAIEREIRGELTEKADEQAINIFGENLRNLLLQSPLKDKVVMGFDPAYRTGCKLAVVDGTGKVLAIDVIYPHKPANESKQKAAADRFKELIETYNIETVAIGNGTASRESELFVSENLREITRSVYYVIVNEAGASVYSASDVARTEFPNLQVEERSAVSIARRLQDPLAELVKIDPKAVGVGQYQHDVSQKRLAEQLDFVVETAVNQVGVNVNTASPELLQHVSGLNKTTAQNIVTFREENGVFDDRKQFKKVPRLGPKAYEQAVGFMRIANGKNIFDNTGIHPESYKPAKALLAEVGINLADLGSAESKAKLEKIDPKPLVDKLDIGLETLEDIIAALIQPGRDMRDEMPAPLLRKDVLSMKDLKVGMELEGTVRNVVDFGAFVDIGVKQDGLVHISKLSDRFVKHPTDVVAVGDVVTVWIEEVDIKKQRTALSMVAPKKKVD